MQKDLSLSEIKNYWERFIKTGELAKKIDSKIAQSWKSAKENNVDPYKEQLDLSLISSSEVEQIKQKIKNEYNIIFEYMQHLHQITKDDGYMISFSDKNGYVLDIIGDEEVLKTFKDEYNYRVGVKWDCSITGSNSTALAIKNNEPIQVIGAEHYCKALHNWACSAAPIHDAKGNLIGVLNISGINSKVHIHTLGMVITSAKAIENQFRLKRLNEELERKNQLEDAIMQTISEGILVLDKDGIVKFINETGGKILNIDLKSAIGKHIHDLVDFRPVILEVLETEEGYVDREFYIRSGGKLLHFIKSATVLRDEKGEMQGVLDTFREISRVKKMVNEMTGAQASFSFDDILGESNVIEKSKRIARIASNSDSNVLIQGETGTGKEIFAQAIHKESKRSDGPFVGINCAALPTKLIESELFGYVEGAFTGASKDGRPGKFELANGGTIFLDEIGEMPINMQAKLLRVLQNKKIVRIGGNEVIPVDVRIIAATNKDLEKEVKRSNFRHDLYYRLNVLNINVPPLRDRKEDIKILAKHFLNVVAGKIGVKETIRFEQAVFDDLREYDWPGNVRELENVIERLINFSDNDLITREDVINFVREQNLYNYNDNQSDSEEQFTIKPLNIKEKEYIKRVLKKCDNNVSKAARLLNVSRNTIYNNVK
ncbi:MAG TPA: sigma 54-interacting transcriptional regulator [Halanaerobiales bacterium]|nr:sigma 54-interacting transcriptional regulator [Halanaerobiales bacterium]